MMLEEIYQYLEKSETIYEFADALVVVRLRQTRDLYMQELDRLDKIPILDEVQTQDYEEYAGDIAALDHIIKLYDWAGESNG